MLTIPILRYTGVDPEVEERGGAHIEWGWCGDAAHAAPGIFLRMYNAQRSKGSGGINLDHMRVLLRPSEITITFMAAGL